MCMYVCTVCMVWWSFCFTFYSNYMQERAPPVSTILQHCCHFVNIPHMPLISAVSCLHHHIHVVPGILQQHVCCIGPAAGILQQIPLLLAQLWYQYFSSTTAVQYCCFPFIVITIRSPHMMLCIVLVYYQYSTMIFIDFEHKSTIYFPQVFSPSVQSNDFI